MAKKGPSAKYNDQSITALKGADSIKERLALRKVRQQGTRQRDRKHQMVSLAVPDELHPEHQKRKKRKYDMPFRIHGKE